jgi:hypothetical protein
MTTTPTFTDEELAEMAAELVKPHAWALAEHQNSTAYVAGLAMLMFFTGRMSGQRGMSDEDATRLFVAVQEARPR